MDNMLAQLIKLLHHIHSLGNKLIETHLKINQRQPSGKSLKSQLFGHPKKFIQ